MVEATVEQIGAGAGGVTVPSRHAASFGRMTCHGRGRLGLAWVAAPSNLAAPIRAWRRLAGATRLYGDRRSPFRRVNSPKGCILATCARIIGE